MRAPPVFSSWSPALEKPQALSSGGIFVVVVVVVAPFFLGGGASWCSLPNRHGSMATFWTGSWDQGPRSVTLLAGVPLQAKIW